MSLLQLSAAKNDRSLVKDLSSSSNLQPQFGHTTDFHFRTEGPELNHIYPSLHEFALFVKVFEASVGAEKVGIRALEAVLGVDILKWILGGDGGI